MFAEKQALDHLILFVPADPTTKLPRVPAFLKDNFVIAPGGFHADGATSNVLILLPDGCYIELISFINPDLVSTHWWGPDASFVGWKDWCLSNIRSPETNYERIKETHSLPIHGGRRRPDGIEVKWAVTFPKGEDGGQSVRGRIPFFCHDVTPRNVRVPLANEKITHPSGVLGVQHLTIVVRDKALLDETRHLYKSVLGDDGVTNGDEVTVTAGRVHDIDGLNSGAKITLRYPKSQEELEKTDKFGFWYGNVVLGAKVRPGKALGTVERLDDPEGQDSVRGLWVEYL